MDANWMIHRRIADKCCHVQLQDMDVNWMILRRIADVLWMILRLGTGANWMTHLLIAGR